MRRIWRILYRSWSGFGQDDGWAIASHIALSGLTSLFPFLILVGALTGMVGAPSLAAKASHIILDAWPPQVADPIVREIENVLTQPRSGLAAISAILAVYFASSGVEAIRIGLNRAYDVRDERPWWILRIESIVYVIFAAIALIGFTFLVVLEPLVWGKIVAFAPELAELEQTFTLARIALMSAILFLLLVIGHKYLAAGQRSLASVLPGVALTGFLWLAFGEGFGFYLARFSQNYISTYAGLASVMIALVFLYSLSAIFVFGGEFNAAVLNARAERRARIEAQKKAGEQIDLHAGSVTD